MHFRLCGGCIAKRIIEPRNSQLLRADADTHARSLPLRLHADVHATRVQSTGVLSASINAKLRCKLADSDVPMRGSNWIRWGLYRCKDMQLLPQSVSLLAKPQAANDSFRWARDMILKHVVRGKGESTNSIIMRDPPMVCQETRLMQRVNSMFFHNGNPDMIPVPAETLVTAKHRIHLNLLCIDTDSLFSSRLTAKLAMHMGMEGTERSMSVADQIETEARSVLGPQLGSQLGLSVPMIHVTADRRSLAFVKSIMVEFPLNMGCFATEIILRRLLLQASSAFGRDEQSPAKDLRPCFPPMAQPLLDSMLQSAMMLQVPPSRANNFNSIVVRVASDSRLASRSEYEELPEKEQVHCTLRPNGLWEVPCGDTEQRRVQIASPGDWVPVEKVGDDVEDGNLKSLVRIDPKFLVEAVRQKLDASIGERIHSFDRIPKLQVDLVVQNYGIRQGRQVVLPFPPARSLTSALDARFRPGGNVCRQQGNYPEPKGLEYNPKSSASSSGSSASSSGSSSQPASDPMEGGDVVRHDMGSRAIGCIPGSTWMLDGLRDPK